MAKGRPKGSTNTAAVVDCAPSRCPTCGSTKRGAYIGSPHEQEYAGLHNGQPYTHIIRRRCQCGEPECGQFRIDRSYENRPAK